MLGGVTHPDIRRILDEFVLELEGCPSEFAPWLEQALREPLVTRLHQLRGAALSAGFVAVGEFAAKWQHAPDPLDPSLAEEFQNTLDASVAAWRAMIR